MLTFIKRTATSWQHDNGTVKSSFGGGIPITNDTENTIVFQLPNGTNFPIKAVVITDCKIIDKTDGDAEYTFATTTEFLDKLGELSYPFINTGGGGGGAGTNLGYTPSSSNGIVTSSTGTDATIPLANGTDAGLSENNVTDSEKSFLLTAGGLDLSDYTNTTDLNTLLGAKADKSTWTDISASATIIGWSSYTTKIVKVKQEYKKAIIKIIIEGASNSQTTTVDAGITSINTRKFVSTAKNNSVEELGSCIVTSGSSVISFQRTVTGTNYGSTGTKRVDINIILETA